ncbi:MAG TPA: DNA gyrase modulator, partial [Bryobacteraceae bacterium]|nr:DNA gyrase modulator [Bryobacteraceae bacterium]
MSFTESFFPQRFGITTRDLEKHLAEALSQGGDYADLYFEYLSTSAISIDESIIKSASQGVSVGVGVRVIAGERTGYAYSDDLSPEKLRKAARVAASIAAAPASVDKVSLHERPRRNLYPVLTAPTETAFADRAELVKRADRAARAYDGRIFQVQASYADNLRQVLIATSEGVLAWDRQPLARLNIAALARANGGPPQRGHAGGGGRVELSFFLEEKTPEHFAAAAAREAIVMLDAVAAPAGEMTVVLGPGWPG